MSHSIFMIAGEPSGDALGASLISGLKVQKPDIEIAGIGGELMGLEGLKSLLPMEELCVMGLSEVISHLPRLMKLINAMVEEVEKRQPDVLVTIDLPDFNFRVAEKLKKNGVFKGKIVHYVAPTVWAWRPKRAQKVAQFLDGMLCLLPFEPPYFQKHGLDAKFAGHPLVENDKAAADPDGFKATRGITKGELCVGLFLGSREAEIKTMSKTLCEVINVLNEQFPNMHVIVPTLPGVEFEVTKAIEGIDAPVYMVTDQNQKWDAFAACDVAVAVSGTVGLELAYMNVPHVITYKTSMTTYLALKALVKVQYAHLANILLNKPAVPELLQGKSNAMAITKEMMRLVKYPAEVQKQRESFAALDKQLRPAGGVTPSQQAAQYVLGMIK